MGGISTKGTGRWEIAVERARKTIAAYPDVFIGYGNLTLSSFLVDRFGEAEGALQQAAGHKKEWIELPQFLVYRYNIAFMTGDNDEMDRAVALAKGKLSSRAAIWLSTREGVKRQRLTSLQRRYGKAFTGTPLRRRRKQRRPSL